MNWRKHGLIFCPDGSSAWARHSAMTPTPLLLNDDVIRVYIGCRDDAGVSRLGFVDLEAKNPANIITFSKEPVLDVGLPGMFDDNGMILGDILRVDEKILMYYVGFQLVQKAKFLAYSGLAISTDGGNSFTRVQHTPIADRTDGALYIRAIHTVRHENGVFKAWYAAGNGWEMIHGTPYPQYNIWYAESHDGVHFDGAPHPCVDVDASLGEYRIGRPRVYKRGEKYILYCTKGTIAGDYLPAFAESADGKTWMRNDDKCGIGLSASGWDSKTLCYPALLDYGDTTYMFYNGNDMGKTGFGYAMLDSK